MEIRFEFYGKHGESTRNDLLDHQIRLLLPPIERVFLELGGERSLDARAAKLIGFPALRERVEGEGSRKAIEELAKNRKTTGIRRKKGTKRGGRRGCTRRGVLCGDAGRERWVRR